MLPVGISTCGKDPSVELFSSFAGAGVSFAELSPEQDGYDCLDYLSAAKAAKESGVKLWSFHLQFMPFELIDVSSLDREKRAFSVSRLCEQIKRAAGIGINKFILHASAEPIPDNERHERLENAKESVFSLSEIARENGGMLCVEDLPRTCLGRDSKEIKELISVSPDVGVCFDTNHLLAERPESFIEALGKRIVTLHVSDYDLIDEKHWLPGEGKIDWRSLYSSLLLSGYNGVWMYELGFGQKKSMPRSRNLVPADFRLNAEEIFSGVYPLTRVL
ncbi:MAG: sugar phosphate isomerase/epimerase [Clostridia bacterium]|nr:sugar phosphate isomerase/epimerase [Clostridia bacterium]